MIHLLDTSCGEDEFVEAPELINGHVVKYTRVRPTQDYVKEGRKRNSFMMVVYKCDEGYRFRAGDTGIMYCSRRKWIGKQSFCEINMGN